MEHRQMSNGSESIPERDHKTHGLVEQVERLYRERESAERAFEHCRQMLKRVEAERDALQARLDSMTEEWGVVSLNEGGERAVNRQQAESWIRQYPENDYKLAHRRVTPWLVEVPESEGQR